MRLWSNIILLPVWDSTGLTLTDSRCLHVNECIAATVKPIKRSLDNYYEAKDAYEALKLGFVYCNDCN